MADHIDLEQACGPKGVVVYAVGDVHGRLDLLTRMHEAITADRERRGARDWRIVHLGDYVDRGPDSAGVVELLSRIRKADERVITLAGNHDTGFLDFLSTGDANGIFARYGGAQTAQSYGVELDYESEAAFRASQQALARSVPAGHVAFLESLDYCESLGDFYFCHAGIRPGVALAEQDPQDLTWIRGEFHRFAGLHPKVVVHGHTPVDRPVMLPNRVNIDTGAFMTGRLTALVVDGAEKTLMDVAGEPRWGG